MSTLEKCRAVSGGRTERTVANVSNDLALQGCSKLCFYPDLAILSKLAGEKLDLQTHSRYEGRTPYLVCSDGDGGRLFSGTDLDRR